MDFELDPRRRQQIQRGGRLESFAHEQFPAYQPRVGIEQALILFGVGVRQRNVTAEPAAQRTHEGVIKVVVGAVEGTSGQVTNECGVVRRLVPGTAAGVV
jgi:hypothetical protein